MSSQSLNQQQQQLQQQGGPRKFSEKIALLNQKQAEGDAAFDLIMSQVHSIVIIHLNIINI
jgi:hypothetical protein